MLEYTQVFSLERFSQTIICCFEALQLSLRGVRAAAPAAEWTEETDKKKIRASRGRQRPWCRDTGPREKGNAYQELSLNLESLPLQLENLPCKSSLDCRGMPSSLTL